MTGSKLFDAVKNTMHKKSSYFFCNCFLLVPQAGIGPALTLLPTGF